MPHSRFLRQDCYARSAAITASARFPSVRRVRGPGGITRNRSRNSDVPSLATRDLAAQRLRAAPISQNQPRTALCAGSAPPVRSIRGTQNGKFCRVATFCRMRGEVHRPGTAAPDQNAMRAVCGTALHRLRRGLGRGPPCLRREHSGCEFRQLAFCTCGFWWKSPRRHYAMSRPHLVSVPCGGEFCPTRLSRIDRFTDGHAACGGRVLLRSVGNSTS